MATEETILRRPKFDLRFVTVETEYHIKYDAKRPDNNFMTESIISLTTKNSLEEDTAAFSFVLAGDMEWDKLLNENDLVIMNISPNEYSPNTPFTEDRPRNKTAIIGLVSEVRLEGSYDNNTKMYRITGQSFQKAFINFELRSIRQAGHASVGKLGWLDWKAHEGDRFMDQVVGKTVQQTAREVIKRFKDKMKYNFIDEDGVEKQNLGNFLENQIVYNINSWFNDEYLQDPLPITSFEGTLNELIKEIAAPPFLEYFFEVITGKEGYEKVWMIIRRTPFDKEDWQKLPTFVLRSRDVLSENFARNDLEAYSIYNVVPEMQNEELSLMSATPWYSDKLVNKYGYKMLEVSSKFITLGSDMDTPGADGETPEGEDYYENTTSGQFGKKLYEWYANNPNFYSGDITVVGHPDYRIGNRLVYKNSNQNEIWEFYIESVDHSFSYEDGYTTTLGVTRGLRVNGMNDHGIRFNPPAGEPKRFKGGYLGEFSLADLEEERKAREAEMKSLIGGNINYDSEHNVTIGPGGFARPANGRVTSPYGMRTHPIHGTRKMHNGVDIAGVDTDIYATASGVVTTATRHGQLGNYVEINHGTVNGTPNVSSLYAHMAKIGVKPGQKVSTGQRIGVQGRTGSATGVHLHFCIKESGKYVNPNKYVKI